MSFRLPFTCLLLLSLAGPLSARAQIDEPSLGDLARSLRQKRAVQKQEAPVIDNDNLSQALADANKLKPSEMVFSVDRSGKGFKVSSDDVTCSLSFSGRAASLLINPVVLEDVPVSELLKLDGPASIQDDNLQLEVFNGTEWELREITVGLTLERKPGENAEMAARARIIPAADGLAAPTIEKHSDVTVLFHLKGTAKPFTTTSFRENVGITPAPDQDWRWSIVAAKGIRPQDSQADQLAGSQPSLDSQLPPEPLPNAARIPLPSVAPPAKAAAASKTNGQQ